MVDCSPLWQVLLHSWTTKVLASKSAFSGVSKSDLNSVCQNVNRDIDGFGYKVSITNIKKRDFYIAYTKYWQNWTWNRINSNSKYLQKFTGWKSDSGEIAFRRASYITDCLFCCRMCGFRTLVLLVILTMTAQVFNWARRRETSVCWLTGSRVMIDWGSRGMSWLVVGMS